MVEVRFYGPGGEGCFPARGPLTPPGPSARTLSPRPGGGGPAFAVTSTPPPVGPLTRPFLALPPYVALQPPPAGACGAEPEGRGIPAGGRWGPVDSWCRPAPAQPRAGAREWRRPCGPVASQFPERGRRAEGVGTFQGLYCKVGLLNFFSN